jgi:hypothetical protein
MIKPNTVIYKAIFCLALVALTISACSPATALPAAQLETAAPAGSTVETAAPLSTEPVLLDPTLEPTSAPATVELLSAYPSDILPLYQSEYIDNCSFTVREDPGYIIGKDLYTVAYISKAPLEEISQYYLQLMTEYDEENSYDNFLSGKIGAHPLFVDLYQDDDAGHVRVVLSLGQAPEQYVTENPYFADYPADLVAVYGEDEAGETTYEYEERLMGKAKETRFVITYSTNLDQDAFKAYYMEQYSGKENFSEVVDQYTYLLHWFDRGYEIHAWFSDYGRPDTRGITLDVTFRE